MLQRQNMSDVLANGIVEGVLGMLVQVLRPAFTFEVAYDFARKILAFEDVDSRLVQQQSVYFGVARARWNVEVPHQYVPTLVGVADARGERHHCSFAENPSRVVCDAFVVEFGIGLEKVFAAGGGLSNPVAA